MSYARKYRPPYTRKPNPAVVAANALWEEARAVQRQLEAELAAMRLQTPDDDEPYEWGGPL